MKRPALLLVSLLAAAAGFVVHRALREPPPPPPPPAAAPAPAPEEDRARAEATLLSAGETALARGQLGAVALALDSIPANTVHAARRAALALALERERARDAGVR